MSFNPSSPLTGAAITGLTSPTHTFVTDSAPDVNAKQWAVSNLGGTQPGASVHSPEKPFTMTVKKPKVLKAAQGYSANLAQFTQTGVNEFTVLFRKGVNILNGYSGVQYRVCEIRLNVKVPAGANNDSGELKTVFSMAGGAISNQLQGIYDMVTTGVF